MESAIESMLLRAFESLLAGQDDRAAAFKGLASRLWQTYMSKIPQDRMDTLRLRPLDEIQSQIIDQLLNPQEGLPPEERAILREKLQMAPEALAPATTNAPPGGPSGGGRSAPGQ
jgi:hypothetical protein